MDISPEKQNIDKVFGTTAYYIDFYQRDYKWNDEPVQRLLDDLFYGFDVAYERNKSVDPSIEAAAARYPWYYLNTYVTNTIDGRVYVVDGQQRLTTLTLILISLMHRASAIKSKLKGWLTTKIAGHAGFETQFWMNHERHAATLTALFDAAEEVPTASGITAENMLANYRLIDRQFGSRLGSQHRFESFVFYFLTRLVLINLSVEQTEVPMVFEVINDRGVRLRPYEILKGKLLGQIDKLELDSGAYNDAWETCVARINAYDEDEIDEFFVYYLKAKFAKTRKLGQRFDSDYHREMFKPDLNETLGLERNPARVKTFIKSELRYYTQLYDRVLAMAIKEQPGFEPVYYNNLNEMNNQFLLILSACTIDDPEEDLKILRVAHEVDRLFSLLQLQRSYDSNGFNDAAFEISAAIRERPAAEIGPVFDAKLLELLSDRRGTQVNSSFEYSHFRNTSVTDLASRFTRYFFARVDRFIAKETNCGEKHPFGDLVTRTGYVNGFHIEHILSYNRENLRAFGNDDDVFEAERNRLGGILLLKGRDNVSSNNEIYGKKLKSYAATLHWNESLRSDSYKSKKDFEIFIERWSLPFTALDSFGPEELESRQALLFELACRMWSAVPADMTSLIKAAAPAAFGVGLGRHHRGEVAADCAASDQVSRLYSRSASRCHRIPMSLSRIIPACRLFIPSALRVPVIRLPPLKPCKIAALISNSASSSAFIVFSCSRLSCRRLRKMAFRSWTDTSGAVISAFIFDYLVSICKNN